MITVNWALIIVLATGSAWIVSPNYVSKKDCDDAKADFVAQQKSDPELKRLRAFCVRPTMAKPPEPPAQ